MAGARQSVVVHADRNVLSHVTTQVRAGKLIIGDVGSFSAKSPMYVEVSVPSLAALDLSGSGTITVTGIRVSRLTVTLSGSGDIYASGSVARLNVSIDGSGDAQFSGLIARNADAAVGGSGTIFVTATQSLNAKAGRRRGPLRWQSSAGNDQHHRQRCRDTRLSRGAMSVPAAHGTAPWTWDEVVLACDLVVQNAWRSMSSATDPRVTELSRLQQVLPLHPPDLALSVG
jgi:Putative auto-transporter adhesin, head GIN domain